MTSFKASDRLDKSDGGNKMNQSTEALENVALIVLRYDYATTGKFITIEMIEATVVKCQPVIHGLCYGDQLQAIVNLCKRLLPNDGRQ